jgi:LmbE family N-acetylglucosaminyl deacetylase
MLPLTFARRNKPPAVLCLGAHADDIEIGIGGTILSLLRNHPGTQMHWVVFSATPERASEARASARAFLHDAGEGNIAVHGFRDGFFPGEFSRLKETFEALKGSFDPDVVFTHHRGDSHQDHRLIAELTGSTFRNHVVLEYEIPKYDPDLGNPNLFVPLSYDCAERKVDILMRYFASQRGRRWFVPETFYGLMRLRGVQSASPSGYAEGFYGSKLCFQFDPAPVDTNIYGTRESRRAREFEKGLAWPILAPSR